MSTAQPDHSRPDPLVRVQVTETVEQLNSRGPMTAAAFEIFAADNGRCELLQGRVKMMSPAGAEHGYIAAKIMLQLGNHVERYQLGRVYAAETGFILERSPDTVRAPDIAYIARDRLPDRGEPQGFGIILPDLVVEVLSPTDRVSEIQEKTRAWIGAGVRCVINVHPVDRTATVHREFGDPREYRSRDQIDLSDVVDGWQPAVESFFG